MKKQFKLGIIGCGNIATAIIKGIADGGCLRTKKVIVSDVNRDRLNEVYETLEVNISDDNRFVAENSEYLLLAVKPQNFAEIAAELKGVCCEKIISVVAGVKKSAIKNSFGVGLVKVARCVPNLPCTEGYGMLGLDVTDFNKSTDDTEFIFNLFGSLGRVLSVSEEKLDAVTGISGSGPAYTFIFIDSLIDAGVKQGLTYDEAKLLAIQTVWGSCGMLIESDRPLSELIMSVCSKGGTTIEAVKVFEQNNFRGIVSDAVEACVKRSKELSDR
ncbi:MAG: pyrroline-5-carboxylate reductase [Roseburia sp.]|nr:pyrroline-5-carboxylate reductase [Roseburia sp.]